MKKYTKIVEAKIFTKGMEDGFQTRWYSSEEKEKCQKNEWYSTWGVKTSSEDASVKIPYILDEDGDEILSNGFGNQYLVIEDGERRFMQISEFEKKHRDLK